MEDRAPDPLCTAQRVDMVTDAERLRMFRDGFVKLRRATRAALQAGDADAARRSVAAAETCFDELRWLYDLLPVSQRERLWMMTSCEPGEMK